MDKNSCHIRFSIQTFSIQLLFLSYLVKSKEGSKSEKMYFGSLCSHNSHDPRIVWKGCNRWKDVFI